MVSGTHTMFCWQWRAMSQKWVDILKSILNFILRDREAHFTGSVKWIELYLVPLRMEHKHVWNDGEIMVKGSTKRAQLIHRLTHLDDPKIWWETTSRGDNVTKTIGKFRKSCIDASGCMLHIMVTYSLSSVIMADEKFLSFHQYLRYSHKRGTIVFSIPGAIQWA